MLFATSSKLTRETREIKRLGDTIETKASLALFSIFFYSVFFFFHVAHGFCNFWVYGWNHSSVTMKAETIVRFVDKSLAKQITNFRLAGP